MNNYKFEDLTKGVKESFEAEVSEEKKRGRAISVDITPWHEDESFAVFKGFIGRVAYGHLTASFYSTLAGYIFTVRIALSEKSAISL